MSTPENWVNILFAAEERLHSPFHLRGLLGFEAHVHVGSFVSVIRSEFHKALPSLEEELFAIVV